MSGCHRHYPPPPSDSHVMKCFATRSRSSPIIELTPAQLSTESMSVTDLKANSGPFDSAKVDILGAL